MEKRKVQTDLLVVGAGIAGISTALEAAEAGFSVTLIEQNPYIGGRIAQLNEYFPKLCPPTCGLEINIKRIRDNRNITLHTMAQVESVAGEAGNYSVKIKIKPRYIKENYDDLAIDRAVSDINFLRSNDFNYSLDSNKVVYLPYNNCFPMKYLLDKSACTDDQLKELTLRYDFIDLDQKEEIIELTPKAIVWATGWKPYDAKKLDTLGYGKYPNVVTNVELERMASPSGPTGGTIEAKGIEEIKEVAFVQCAGSRDENHLEYCSSICCLASMKHARYIRSQYPDANIHIFYIDLRAHGVFEDFYQKTDEDPKVFFHRGKVAKVFKEPLGDKLIVEAENTLEMELRQAKFDMVVLATGMQPALDTKLFPEKNAIDENGFIRNEYAQGMVGCGVATSPKDVAAVVQEATGAAMRAIHIIKGVN